MACVQAEFDFEAQSGTAEMSLKAGEILTVIQDNIEGGWIEGRNSRGKIGLFPASYVVPCASSSMPAAPPPTLPAMSSKPSFDDWGSSTFAAPHPTVAQPSYPALQPSGGSGGGSTGGLASYLKPTQAAVDDFDDDWSDEDEDEEPRSNSTAASGAIAGGPSIGQARPTVSRSASAGDGRTVSTVSSQQSIGGGAAKLKGNITLFNSFAKTGMEAFVMNEAAKTSGQMNERTEIIILDGMVRWKPDSKQYTCNIDKPKKETKMKGLKSFIAYSLTSSLSGIQVSRRYKHFDWLQEILAAKYLTIALPPLPEKQVSGRYEEDLIDHRKKILQLWVDKICRHPVLSKSDVWLHFLTCTDEKQWKIGKRKAEKDEYVGGAYLHCISVPNSPLNQADVEGQVESFNRNVRVMENGSQALSERLGTYQRLLGGPVKQNWQKIGGAFGTLANAFKEDKAGPASMRLAEALHNTAHHFHEIGEEYEQHARQDVEPVLEHIYSYRGTVQRVPDIVNIYKQGLHKWRDTENRAVEGKLSNSQVVKIKERVDAMSYVVLAEVNHLNTEKTEDFRQFIGDYLKKQQEFYAKLARTMGDLAKQYE